MVIAPQTNIILLKVPLELSNKNQLTFSNKQAQYNYFNSLEKLERENTSYQRKDGVIRFPELIDNLFEYNYVMYRNEAYSEKWFYAFITSMRYLNDNTTEISIATDCFQTWQFDLEYKQSFVEREMIAVNEDVAGANLIPEGLENGEMKVAQTFSLNNLRPIPCIAYTANSIPQEQAGNLKTFLEGSSINGMYSPVTFIICNSMGDFDLLLNCINLAGYGDYVISAFTVPYLAVSDFMTTETKIGVDYTAYLLAEDTFTQTIFSFQNIPSTPSNLDTYIPRNQKLRTYPYVYLGFNPSQGSSKIYRYEDFENGKPNFTIISEVNPNPTTIFIPQNYRGANADSLQDITSLNGYPMLSTKTDYFNSWLAQNSSILSVQLQQEQFNYQVDAMKAGTNLFTSLLGNSLGEQNIGQLVSDSVNGALNLASLDKNHEFYIKGQMAQIEKQQLLPDKVTLGSSNTTLLSYDLLKDNIFTVYTIKRQFAERIDKFFDMYGYLTNTLKLPNLNNRPNWNYVKTIGINIISHIPQGDLQVIKNMFDNGITLWHNPSTFLDYSQNNR